MWTIQHAMRCHVRPGQASERCVQTCRRAGVRDAKCDAADALRVAVILNLNSLGSGNERLVSEKFQVLEIPPTGIAEA